MRRKTELSMSDTNFRQYENFNIEYIFSSETWRDFTGETLEIFPIPCDWRLFQTWSIHIFECNKIFLTGIIKESSYPLLNSINISHRNFCWWKQNKWIVSDVLFIRLNVCKYTVWAIAFLDTTSFEESDGISFLSANEFLIFQNVRENDAY